MIESFLFIPPTINNFADKVKNATADYVVIDFEESIKNEQFDEFILLVTTSISKEKVFVRPTLRNEDGTLFIEQYAALLLHGFRKFILPKIETLNDLKFIYETNPEVVKECTYILGIESPIAFISINQLINNGYLCFWGLVFGSHDYCFYSGMTHNLDTLTTARFMISTYASAYKLKSIDIASINTGNKDEFFIELLTTAEYGFSAKTIIHPNQLSWLTEFNNEYINAQLSEAKAVIDHFKKIGEPLIFKFKDKIYERPHVKRLMEILEKKQNNK